MACVWHVFGIYVGLLAYRFGVVFLHVVLASVAVPALGINHLIYIAAVVIRRHGGGQPPTRGQFGSACWRGQQGGVRDRAIRAMRH